MSVDKLSRCHNIMLVPSLIPKSAGLMPPCKQPLLPSYVHWRESRYVQSEEGERGRERGREGALYNVSINGWVRH